MVSNFHSRHLANRKLGAGENAAKSRSWNADGGRHISSMRPQHLECRAAPGRGGGPKRKEREQFSTLKDGTRGHGAKRTIQPQTKKKTKQKGKSRGVP